MNKNKSYKLVSIAVCSLVVCFGIAFYAFGWTEPSVTPPGGNAAAPLNVSATGQAKIAGLTLNVGSDGAGGTCTGSAVNGLLVECGNVGIGIASPSAKLDVNGTIKATGLQITSGAGAGKILTSDASGNAAWQVGLTSGTYTGNGAATQFISIGFQPKAIMIIPHIGSATNDVWVKTTAMGSYARNITEGEPTVPSTDMWSLNVIVSFGAAGFTVGSGSGNDLNTSGVVYSYIVY